MLVVKMGKDSTYVSSLSVPRKQRTSVGPSKTLAQPRRNIVGCRIQHIWKEGSKCDRELVRAA